jgi:hypothetical protein
MWTGPEIVKRRRKLFAFCMSLLLLLGLYGTLMATLAPGVVAS